MRGVVMAVPAASRGCARMTLRRHRWLCVRRVTCDGAHAERQSERYVVASTRRRKPLIAAIGRKCLPPGLAEAAQRRGERLERGGGSRQRANLEARLSPGLP